MWARHLWCNKRVLTLDIEYASLLLLLIQPTDMLQGCCLPCWFLSKAHSVYILLCLCKCHLYRIKPWSKLCTYMVDCLSSMPIPVLACWKHAGLSLRYLLVTKWCKSSLIHPPVSSRLPLSTIRRQNPLLDRCFILCRKCTLLPFAMLVSMYVKHVLVRKWR